MEWNIGGEIGYFCTETSHFENWLHELRGTIYKMSGLLEYWLTEQILHVLDPDFRMRRVYIGRDSSNEKPGYIVDIWELNDSLELYLEFYEYLIYQIDRHHNFWPTVQMHLEQQFSCFEPELISKMYCASK